MGYPQLDHQSILNCLFKLAPWEMLKFCHERRRFQKSMIRQDYRCQREGRGSSEKEVMMAAVNPPFLK